MPKSLLVFIVKVKHHLIYLSTFNTVSLDLRSPKDLASRTTRGFQYCFFQKQL